MKLVTLWGQIDWETCQISRLARNKGQAPIHWAIPGAQDASLAVLARDFVCFARQGLKREAAQDVGKPAAE